MNELVASRLLYPLQIIGKMACWPFLDYHDNAKEKSKLKTEYWKCHFTSGHVNSIDNHL